jgi:hypothetical protein
MNCFNIREVQSLLKRKFFVDLINTQDAHALSSKTVVGLRYRLNNAETVTGNFLVFLNFGPNIYSQNRNTLFLQDSRMPYLFINSFDKLAPSYYLRTFAFLDFFKSKNFVFYYFMDLFFTFFQSFDFIMRQVLFLICVFTMGTNVGGPRT